ncbi:hypothetical protein ACLOJK_026708 [Asimina triloba]
MRFETLEISRKKKGKGPAEENRREEIFRGDSSKGHKTERNQERAIAADNRSKRNREQIKQETGGQKASGNGYSKKDSERGVDLIVCGILPKSRKRSSRIFRAADPASLHEPLSQARESSLPQISCHARRGMTEVGCRERQKSNGRNGATEKPGAFLPLHKHRFIANKERQHCYSGGGRQSTAFGIGRLGFRRSGLLYSKGRGCHLVLGRGRAGSPMLGFFISCPSNAAAPNGTQPDTAVQPTDFARISAGIFAAALKIEIGEGVK